MAAHSLPVPPTNAGGNPPRWTQPVSFYGQSVFSKYYAHSICAFLLLIPFLVMPVQSQATQGPIGGQSCVTTYDPTVNYFPNPITVDDAALFSVRYEKNYKVVTNTAVGVNQSFVLTQCGTPAPNASLFSNTTVFVNVPVSNLASLATTAVAYIEMLGRRSAIKAVDTEGLVSSPCVQYGLNHSEIIGLEDKNQTLRAEQLGKVDVIFSSFGSEVGSENKTVVTSEVSDPGPLNRAEWLEFYSTFFNLEEAAQNLTSTINNNYNCFKKAANAKTTKPVIAWASYVAPSSYNNNTASWGVSGAAYKKILSEDAGATFFNGTTTGTFTTAAAFADALKDVDVLIDETFTGNDINAFYQSYGLSASSPHKFIQNKAIFREDGIINPNDGRDWFSGAVVMDDAVLQDVVRAVHPDALPANVPYNWLRNIAKGETMQTLTSANCTNPDSNAPIPDRAIVCSTMKVGGSGSGGNAGSKTVAGALTVVLSLLAAAIAL
ncbi:hypothetical protein BC939DRAFT_450166 [Gamsiella multidivaricata]|uniref:uncharacterized protein n=1 Tax=Gamsiella multidivaricata TaxID=101098 RepID=UPI00221FC0F1|nr:uncharacterized protein BC939DRAFT_450166 [Gamsiella multidivaricata]KAG0350669.1 hypothetical protein BGZ54_003690 [Gamsiella multidivaricata]KAI7824358.1 hypothetical protein BC939DRAFT_450166 [Gamsiella multidivaricata]